jgi:hypothetical protein
MGGKNYHGSIKDNCVDRNFATNLGLFGRGVAGSLGFKGVKLFLTVCRGKNAP